MHARRGEIATPACDSCQVKPGEDGSATAGPGDQALDQHGISEVRVIDACFGCILSYHCPPLIILIIQAFYRGKRY